MSNLRHAGRKPVEGRRRLYTVPDDVHDWIMTHGGSRYLTNTMRAIIATSGQKE